MEKIMSELVQKDKDSLNADGALAEIDKKLQELLPLQEVHTELARCSNTCANSAAIVEKLAGSVLQLSTWVHGVVCPELGKMLEDATKGAEGQVPVVLTGPTVDAAKVYSGLSPQSLAPEVAWNLRLVCHLTRLKMVPGQCHVRSWK